jgi:energy-converting hydrogenase Eha subunit F
MRIKALGFLFTLAFGLIFAYLIVMGMAGVAFIPPAPITLNRFVSPEIVYDMIHALGDMLWHYRGIDMVLQGAFLFVAALAASVFFHVADPKSTDPMEEE